jgi:2-polyprenyl-3-methyl-5-hydroxy-6-metoxy-1,4-benzoquinol methylase
VKAESFFDKYADEYDWLTNATARVEGHQQEVDAIIKQFQPTRVLDAGCATGLTTSLFASKGVEAVGLDRSRQMLKIAEGKYSSTGLPLDFRWGSFEALPKNLSNSFDLVVCLANSIVGVESRVNLARSMAGFVRMLRPGGHIITQALNISALRDRMVMPVKTTQHDGIIYSRFLERVGTRSVLYIARTDTRHTPLLAELFRHESVSFTREVLTGEMKRAGFTGIRAFADLVMTRRFSNKSRDIVLAARKR